MPICSQSWGSYDKGWTWCCLERGHPGICVNSVMGAKPEGAKTYDEQPECAAAWEKSVLEDRKREAKKAAKSE